MFLIVFLALSLVYVKNALHMFQQNRYELYRYSKWLFNKNNIRYTNTLTYLLVLSITYLVFKSDILVLCLTIIYSIIAIELESNKEYIKELVYTARVKRQIAVMSVLMIVITYALVTYVPYALIPLFVIYLPYLLIYPMHIVTNPIESAIKKAYENNARKILNSMDDLTKIGITGSFGKTTTKNIVTDIISSSYLTLMTPASYNTPMGITRTIREMLKPIHEVFVCEMGADHVGEITYLMKFVKPKYGIVTSIGPQHLNTFKSMENIIKEKMQMIELLPEDGVGILNGDNEFINNYEINNTCKIVKVGIKNADVDYQAKNIKYSKDGSSFEIKIDKKNYKFKTALLGEHNIMNLLAGIALAIEMGIDIKTIVKNVSEVNRVEHRLELKNINGFTFIDNAFNSNPVGCKLSLDVLKLMPGKRIIVTPGLIDLGNKEKEYNYDFGSYMKDRADFVILVGEKTSQPILRGLQDSDFDMSKCIVCKSVKEAFTYVYANFSVKDTILLENDLPDAFLY